MEMIETVSEQYMSKITFMFGLDCIRRMRTLVQNVYKIFKRFQLLHCGLLFIFYHNRIENLSNPFFHNLAKCLSLLKSVFPDSFHNYLYIFEEERVHTCKVPTNLKKIILLQWPPGFLAWFHLYFISGIVVFEIG